MKTRELGAQQAAASPFLVAQPGVKYCFRPLFSLHQQFIHLLFFYIFINISLAAADGAWIGLGFDIPV